MTAQQSLNETNLARDCLRRLSEESGIVARSAAVLELVGKSSVGLGEVLQDYARQTQAQLREFMRAAHQLCAGMHGAEELKVIECAPFTMKTAKSVLEMIPGAMQRNKAEMVGDKEGVSREQIVALSHAFRESADVARVIAAEEADRSLAALFAAPEGKLASAGDAPMLQGMHH